MEPHISQCKVLDSNARFKVLNCGRGFGKTALAVELLLIKASIKGLRRVAYIGPTIQQTRDIAWLRLLERTKGKSIKSNSTTLDLVVPAPGPSQSTIVLRGWEAVETLRGQEFDMLVIDEVASMKNFWVGWNEVLRPTLRMSQGEVVFISSPKGFNHFYDLFNTKLESWESFHFTSYDNPYLPTTEIELARAQMPPDAFAQEYLADFRKMSGLCLPEFSRERHLKVMPEKNKLEAQKFVGVDFGWQDPLAISTVYKDTSGCYWITSEYCKSHITEPAMVEYVKALDGITYPDPANPQSIEALKMAQVRIRDVVKSKDSIMSGLNKMKELFINDKLFIDPSCQNLISELEQYVFDEDKIDTPEDDHNHMIDSVRYVIMMTYFREAYIEPPKPQVEQPFKFVFNPREEVPDDTPLWQQK